MAADEETAVLAVTAGRGPVECAAALNGFVAALGAAAREEGVESADDASAGVLSASVVLSGPGAHDFAARWSGNVQWTDPALRGRGARRNWYLACRPVGEAAGRRVLDPADVRFEAMRAGGPGGQHQNTTDSAVRAVHVPTGLSAVARDGRSQHANRKLALRRLERLLAAAYERRRLEADRRAWLERIAVERGNPDLVFCGGRRLR